MPTKKVSARALLRKHLGTKSGDALLNKIRKMAAAGASPSKIEKAVSQHLADHILQQVASAVKPLISMIRPLSAKSMPISISNAHAAPPQIKPHRRSK